MEGWDAVRQPVDLLPSVDNVLGDSIGYVRLIDWMGGDQYIVNRARKCYQSQDRSTPATDVKLLGKLVSSKPLHGTTTRGTIFTFDMVAPLFVVRQNTRHLVGHDFTGADTWYCGTESIDIGGAFDEQSFRYTDHIRFYIPQDFETQEQETAWREMCQGQLDNYMALRTKGLTKERARCALGNQVYSQYEWTVNTQALLDFLQKRLPGGGAQNETTKYALAVLRIVEQVIPETIEVWLKDNDNEAWR